MQHIVKKINAVVRDHFEKRKIEALPKTCGLLVNYKTLKITKYCLTSFRKFYPRVPLIVIDNSDYDQSSDWLYQFAKKDTNTMLLFNTYNMHHGPSMHNGIILAHNLFENVLIFDSDILFLKSNIIEDMLTAIGDKKFICCGIMGWVDNNGLNVKKNEGIPYVHPRCILININEYLKLPPFQKHGAPCLDTMKFIYDNKLTNLLIEFDIDPYVKHLYKGTVNETGGYHLK